MLRYVRTFVEASGCELFGGEEYAITKQGSMGLHIPPYGTELAGVVLLLFSDVLRCGQAS